MRRTGRGRFGALVATAAATIAIAACWAPAAQAADPFSTEDLTVRSPGGGLERPAAQGAIPCRFDAQAAPLSLADVVDRALCNNPQTREAWANARYQAAQVGAAQSAYLPTIGLTLSESRNRTQGASASSVDGADVRDRESSASLSLNYLLFDFGGRAAARENARQLLDAANATRNAVSQSVFLAAVQAYFQWNATQETLLAARASEQASLESLKAATARYQAGRATPADRLQAQTAASQATLSRIRAEGDVNSARGVLSNVIGLPADQPVEILPPQEIGLDARSETEFVRRIAELVDEARRNRPDLAAVEAQVNAARAGIDAARSNGLPALSLYATGGDTHHSVSSPVRNSVIGLSLNIPLFSGFGNTYQIRSAEAQLDAKLAQRDKLALQVSLDVWRAYQAMLTEIQAVRAAGDLLESATQSEKVAQGRYRAGVGGILDLLNAQSALAAARQQHIQELYNWRLARVTLAQAMGRLDFAALENRRENP